MRVTLETKQATEKAIKAAARKLFVRKGLDATNTREIARAADIAVGTLFNYFPSKEALAIAIASEAFTAGRRRAHERMTMEANLRGTLDSELFSLIACDIRALEPIRSFVQDVLEAGLSPFTTGAVTSEAVSIRTERLGDARTILERHGLGEAATSPVMHLYWSLYLGVLSFWATDDSPKQEDTWALLDQSVQMFSGSLKRSPARAPDLALDKEMIP